MKTHEPIVPAYTPMTPTLTRHIPHQKLKYEVEPTRLGLAATLMFRAYLGAFFSLSFLVVLARFCAVQFGPRQGIPSLTMAILGWALTSLITYKVCTLSMWRWRIHAKVMRALLVSVMTAFVFVSIYSFYTPGKHSIIGLWVTSLFALPCVPPLFAFVWFCLVSADDINELKTRMSLG